MLTNRGQLFVTALLGAASLWAETPATIGADLTKAVKEIVAIGQIGQLCSMELARLKPESQRLTESLRIKEKRFNEVAAAIAKATTSDERKRLTTERDQLYNEGKAGNAQVKVLEKQIADRTACVATTEKNLLARISVPVKK